MMHKRYQDEFDDDFREALLKTITSNRLPGDICFALGLDNHSRAIQNTFLRRFIYKFNRVSLSFLTDFMRINVFENESKRRRPTSRRMAKFIHMNNGAPKLWPYCVVAYFITAVVRTIFNTYHQYVYDANTMRLQPLEKYLSNASDHERFEALFGVQHPYLHRLQSEWHQRADRARETLQFVGSSHLEWSFAIQSIVWIFLIPAVCNYLAIPLLYRVSDMVLVLPMALVDNEDSKRLRVELMLSELDRFSADCLAFSRTKLEQTQADLIGMLPHNLNEPVMRIRLNSLYRDMMPALGVQFHEKQLETIGQLKGCALKGRLNSLNDTPACRDRTALMYFSGCLFMILYAQCVLYFGYMGVKAHFEGKGTRVHLDNIKDISDAFNLWLIVEVTINSALCMLVLSAPILFDMIGSVTKLRALIVHVIWENGRKFQQLVDPSSSLGACYNSDAQKTLQRDFELDLMMVVLQCRLISRAFDLSRRPLAICSTSLLYFTIATTLIFKIHSPYYEPKLREVGLLTSIANDSLCLCLLIPLGLMHRRAIKAFAQLWSLVAQLSHFETFPAVNKCLEMNSSVAVFTLRRNLADQHLTTNQFTCRVLSIPITYNNLIKVAFWTFLLVVSVSSNANIYSDRLSGLIQDPFGLYSFAKSYS